jgi:hypothetical protein
MSSEIDKLMDVIVWIEKNIRDIELPSDEKTLLSAGCFDSAIEHQEAISLLHNASLYGSMFSLLRVITESFVKGLWIYNCATDKEIEKFKKDKLNKKFYMMLSEYEAKIDDSNGVLTQFKNSAWSSMNGFVHTGFIQVSRRYSSGALGEYYGKIELSHALGVAGALGLLAASQLVGMAGRSDLTEPFLDKMKEYSNTEL